MGMKNMSSHRFFYAGLRLLLLSGIGVCALTTTVHAEPVFTLFDVPGATTTAAYGIDDTNIVGYYTTGSYASRRGFLYDGSTFTILNVPGSTFTDARGIDGTNIVGCYGGADGYTHGFIYDGTTYTTLDMPGEYNTTLTGINGTNIVGNYIGADYYNHAFLYDGANFISINVPDSQSTSANGIDRTTIVGEYYYTTGPTYAFLYDGSSYMTLASVSSNTLASMYARGVDGAHIVGINWDGYNQGFLFDGSTYTTLNVPGIYGTYANGIDGSTIVGSAGSHGFFATLPTLTLTVSGSGTVTSDPVGISCGVDCSEAYASSASVILTATPSAGSRFASWTGCDIAWYTLCQVAMSASKTVRAVFKTLPDLSFTSLSGLPVALRSGFAFSVTDTVRNAGGSKTAPFTIGYYLSTESSWNWGSIRLSGTRSVANGLSAGAASTGTTTVTVPPRTPAGTYYLIACADTSGAVAETDEANNCAGSLSTTAIAIPDLRVASHKQSTCIPQDRQRLLRYGYRAQYWWITSRRLNGAVLPLTYCNENIRFCAPYRQPLCTTARSGNNQYRYCLRHDSVRYNKDQLLSDSLC
jgi:hypothetical protein